jgi:hypothetical protein
MVSSKTKRKPRGSQMETIDTQNHYELGDIQNRLKEKAKEYNLHDTAWMEAYQNAEYTAVETNNFEEYIKEGWTWIDIFERIAFDSLDDSFFHVDYEDNKFNA